MSSTPYPATAAAAKLPCYSPSPHLHLPRHNNPVVSFPCSIPGPHAALAANARAARQPVAVSAGHRRLMVSLTNTEGLKFGVVVARFNEILTNLLLRGALETLQRYSVRDENVTVPCIFGVLTCDDMDQALNRAGGKAGNKGVEAALTAIEMATLFRHPFK